MEQLPREGSDPAEILLSARNEAIFMERDKVELSFCAEQKAGLERRLNRELKAQVMAEQKLQI